MEDQSDIVEICFSFDTTGSMYRYLEAVRSNLLVTIEKLFKQVPNIRIALIAHGDYCDAQSSYIIKYCDFCRDEKLLLEWIQNAGKTGGGGNGGECYELVLRTACNALEWSVSATKKVLVIIGDECPHSAGNDVQKRYGYDIDWKQELNECALKQIIIHGVHAKHRYQDSRFFYERIAEQTGGQYLSINNMQNMSSLFMALCLSSSDSNQFEEFANEIMQIKDVNDELIELQTALRKLGTWMPSIPKISNEMYKNNAIKRIMRDLRELKCCYHELNIINGMRINAVPLENNLFECHCNMSIDYGILKDIIFHFVIFFADNYPSSPPKINVMTYFNHPNILKNNSICLDMLNSDTKSQRYRGWTSGYSIYSVLCQLQTFLFASCIKQDHGKILKTAYYFKSGRERMFKESINYNCSKCGHQYNSPYPQIIKHKTVNKNKLNNSTTNRTKINYFLKYVCKSNELIILSFLQISDFIKLSKTCFHFEELIKSTNKIKMDKYRCWYHRIDLSQLSDNNGNDIILGYGITPRIYGQSSIFKCGVRKTEIARNEDTQNINSRKEIIRFPMLKTVHSTFDLLSRDAFENFGVRHTLWKDMSFTHWIPIYIVKQHGQRALPLFEKICSKIFNKLQFHPFMGLHLIAMLMNSIVVDVMTVYDQQRSQRNTNLFHSINLFECYFHFYHLLLSLYNKYKKILKPFISTKCSNFIQNEEFRKKKYIPNIGEFLIYFTLYDCIDWASMSNSILNEVFIRRCKWVIQSNPEIVVINDRIREIKINFEASKISSRLLLFQYFFLKYCCKIGDIKNNPTTKMNEFNANFGMPPSNLPQLFQKFIKNVDKMQCYNDFFAMIGVKEIGTTKLWQWLRKSMKTSFKRGYHVLPFQYRPKAEQERIINKKKRNILNDLRKKKKYGKKNRYENYNNNSVPKNCQYYIHKKRKRSKK